MEIDDAALMFEGWYDGMIYEQTVARKMTVLIADAAAGAMGAKGTAKRIMKAWHIDGDNKSSVDQKLIQKLKEKRNGNRKT